MAEASSLVRLQKEKGVQLDWVPFELHPETPKGGKRLDEYFGAARIAGMRAHLERFAASFGVTGLKFAERMPNTRAALAMAEYARDHGKLDDFRHAAMDAYWREGRDLEDEAVLRGLAEKCGLSPEEALAARDDDQYVGRLDEARFRGERAGVNGIPSFVIGPWRIDGCQPYELLARAVDEAQGGKA